MPWRPCPRRMAAAASQLDCLLLVHLHPNWTQDSGNWDCRVWGRGSASRRGVRGAVAGILSQSCSRPPTRWSWTKFRVPAVAKSQPEMQGAEMRPAWHMHGPQPGTVTSRCWERVGPGLQGKCVSGVGRGRGSPRLWTGMQKGRWRHSGQENSGRATFTAAAAPTSLSAAKSPEGLETAGRTHSLPNRRHPPRMPKGSRSLPDYESRPSSPLSPASRSAAHGTPPGHGSPRMAPLAWRLLTHAPEPM